MKKFKILTVLFCALLIISCATTQTTKDLASEVLLEKNVNIEEVTDELEFVNALNSIGSELSVEDLVEPEVLTVQEAIQHTLEAVDMTELALTFPQEKSEKLLDQYGVTATNSEKDDQIAAAALLVDLIDSAWYKANLEDKNIDAEDVEYLLKAMINVSGISIKNTSKKDYLGMVSDEDIYAKILENWDDYEIVQDNPLVEVVDKGVINGVTTGYNVVWSKDNCVFDPALTINYGHGDIKHAIQLIALLKSEGLEVKVDFQGKTSAFLYLAEWGEPTEDYSFKVRKIPSGDYVAYCKEYNLFFEFESAEDKVKFNDVILSYAKKDVEDEEGLIYASWWQPLYSSHTEMGEGYRTITDNVITMGDIEAHPFSLNDNVEKTVDGFLQIDDSLNIDSRVFWVNQAFYNYLSGEDFK